MPDCLGGVGVGDDSGGVHDHAEGIAHEMLRLFRGDNRRVMNQTRGGYGIWRRRAITKADLVQHVEGRVSAAIYLLDQEARCSAVCFDIDIPKVDIPTSADERINKKRREFLPVVERIIDYLRSVNAIDDEAILLEDTGGRGYHVWLFFENPEDGVAVSNFANEVRMQVGADCLEVFPPRGRHGPKGFSKSLVRLPLGLHLKYEKSRSHLLSTADFERVPDQVIASYLRSVAFTCPTVLESSGERVRALQTKALAEGNPRTESDEKPEVSGKAPSVGSMLSVCPALSGIVAKARREGHLLHHERVAMAITLLHFSDGQTTLNRIMGYCSDYSERETQRHLDSLVGYRPISCHRLQSMEYQICSAWCNEEMENAERSGQSPTPLWFARSTRGKLAPRDGLDVPAMARVASIANLRVSWLQARAQARERDMFEDVAAYRSFEEHLWANLHVLRAELLSGTWQHQPFRTLPVPKSPEQKNNTRPMCWATPWDAIVALAVLNVIGPVIDSTFHRNSLGNRLAKGPRADGEVFEDWRVQNRYREIRREGFAEHGVPTHFVLTDISKFYECVRHDRLMSLLQQRVGDQEVLGILQQFIDAEWVVNSEQLTRKDPQGLAVGLPQGPALSSFLANLYLDDLDAWLEERCVDFVRYVDDLAVLFESELDAREGQEEIRQWLEQECYLSINVEKTEGPVPSDDVSRLADWLRDARYQLVGVSHRGSGLTAPQKAELRAALHQVSGAGLLERGDPERITRLLGFYVANIERLEEHELQRNVYLLARYVLTEQRPRHNATCIAVRALIKASTYFADDVWRDFKALIDAREDTYFKVVLAQEARRFLKESTEGTTLHPGLALTIERQLVDGDETAAAAALGTLTAAKGTTASGRDAVWHCLLGGSSYLQARASDVLMALESLRPTDLARITTGDADDLAILLVCTRSAITEPVLSRLAKEGCELSRACHAAAPLLEVSMSCCCEEGLRAVRELACMQNEESRRNICHHLASAYVNGVVDGYRAAENLRDLILTASKAAIPQLAAGLYNLGRYSGIAHDDIGIEESLSSIGEVDGPSDVTTKLPVLNDVELGEMIGAPGTGRWLHHGLLEGRRQYHEVLAASELAPLGVGSKELVDVLEALQDAGTLLLDEAEVATSHGRDYVLARVEASARWGTVASWTEAKERITPEECLHVLEGTVSLLFEVERQFTARRLPRCVLPVPCCWSLAIEGGGQIRLRNIMSGMGGGRQYVGLRNVTANLPIDEWEVYALGLLFFELATGRCAATAARDLQPRHLAQSDECLLRGQLFAGIVGKACARSPESRYENAELFLKDVREWCSLESAISGAGFGEAQSRRLRRLWHIQLGLERRAYLAASEHDSFLDVAHGLAEYVLKELEAGGELSEQWMRAELIEVSSGDASVPHVVTSQCKNAAGALNREWLRLTEAVGVKRDFTAPAWIQCAGVALELEAIRRALCRVAESGLQSECKALCVELGTRDLTGCTLRLHGATSNEGAGGNCDPMAPRECVAAIPDRLLRWLGAAIPASAWPLDLAVMAVVLAIASDGLAVKAHEENVFAAGPTGGVKIKNGAEVWGCLLDVLRSDSHRFPRMRRDQQEVAVFAAEAIPAVEALRETGILDRLFGNLQESAFMALYTEQDARLDVSEAARLPVRTIEVRMTDLLPFPTLGPHHREGCPFSVDLIRGRKSEAVVTGFSLPRIVLDDEDGELLPRLARVPDSGWLRGWGSWRVWIGSHTLLPLVIPLSYGFQVYARARGWVDDHDWVAVLYEWIGNHVPWATWGPYLWLCDRRRRRLNRRAHLPRGIGRGGKTGGGFGARGKFLNFIGLR